MSVADDVRVSPASWYGVMSLGLGIAAIVLSGFIPASLLPVMADGLQGTAGRAVSITASCFLLLTAYAEATSEADPGRP